MCVAATAEWAEREAKQSCGDDEEGGNECCNHVWIFTNFFLSLYTFFVLFLWIWDYNMYISCWDGVEMRLCVILIYIFTHKNEFERKVRSSITLNSNYYRGLESKSPAHASLPNSNDSDLPPFHNWSCSLSLKSPMSNFLNTSAYTHGC